MFYKDIYEGLKRYKDDKLFLMEVPDAEKMIRALEDEDESLFERKFFHEFSDRHYYLSIFITFFEEKREDIKWYYENKETTLKKKRRYEFINDDGGYDEREMDNILDIYNRCVTGGYGQSVYYLYNEDWLFILTKEIGDDKKCPVKFALETLNDWIKYGYEDYEKNCRKNRNIFLEKNENGEDL